MARTTGVVVSGASTRTSERLATSQHHFPVRAARLPVLEIPRAFEGSHGEPRVFRYTEGVPASRLRPVELDRGIAEDVSIAALTRLESMNSAPDEPMDGAFDPWVEASR
jgi:hypothetical protein